MSSHSVQIERLSPYLLRIPKQGGMRVDGHIYVSEPLYERLGDDQAIQQVVNVAHLPGIVGAALAMPDIHWGYGFPIGGVAAFDVEDGVISPGGVGYDINCGVRLLRTHLAYDELRSQIPALTTELFRTIPTGVGAHHKQFRLSRDDLRNVATRGAAWAVQHGYGTPDDIEHIENRGCLPGADPAGVSEEAFVRGTKQLGTLGSGNHFCEIGYVYEIFDDEAAATMGLHLGTVTVIIHSGSRGFGYQICDDSLRIMLPAMTKYHLTVPDRQLCCVPLRSDEGRQYLAAMACAANFAFANRQMMTHLVRESFAHVLGMGPADLGIELIYDVAHNIAKFERHTVEGQQCTLCVHRKGATRAFPAGHPDIPAAYQQIGQPVLIPGDMGRSSFVLVGQPGAMQHTFGSTCHGAGRCLSRKKATTAARGRDIIGELAQQGITVHGASRATIVEEMPEAYKDVSLVVNTCAAAGLSKKVAMLKPVGVIKG